MTVSPIRPRTERQTAAQRMLAVLDAFDPDHLLLSLTDIARRSGLSLSTAHRLVGELRSWGALDRARDGRYSVGLRILELGALAPQGLHLRDVALPYLGDLQHATHANVHLAVRDGHDMVYVESLHARGGVRVLSRLGGRWPLYATGTGQVLLAFAPGEFREEVLASDLRRYTPHTLCNAADLRRALAQVRKTGVAVADEQLTPGALALAVPLRSQRDRVVAALGVTVRTGSVPPHSLLPALHATARAISRALGAPSAMRPPGDTLTPPRARRSGSPR